MDKLIRILKHLAMMDMQSIYCYKIYLLLLEDTYTQSQVSEALAIKRQNAIKYFKELENLNLIYVDRIEGRNKFYKAETNLAKIQSTLPGQTKIKI
ncbi:transcriptional regulator [Clostridium sp. 19966]|uniref:transcriptional regulator n=1 Tax=Clostridium sp. 19966 TaxID=2768166 RepID=UPI0028DEF0E5|nr:transcriptional regulator [Clostridium sp. 19966]MDT8718281.1 transcriptional regulator [Clostridium sp. 19966]